METVDVRTRRALTDDRARSRDAEDQCWICLDGDTAGREVRDYALEIRRRGRGDREIAFFHFFCAFLGKYLCGVFDES